MSDQCRGYVVPPERVQRDVKAFIERHGEKVAVAHFAVARATLARIAGGLTVQSLTLRAIEESLKTAPAGTAASD